MTNQTHNCMSFVNVPKKKLKKKLIKIGTLVGGGGGGYLVPST